MEKIRTTIYIDKNLMEIAHLEIDNFSEVINTLLESYLSVNSMENLNKEIIEKEKILSILKNKKQKMIREGITNNKKEGMNEQILNELRSLYIKRREQIGNNKELDLEWIMSPKNNQRCKLLNKDPMIITKELQDWYTTYLVSTQK